MQQALYINYIAFLTIVKRESRRIFRIWSQVFLPPVITIVLYFVIFGHLIGSRIGMIHGVPYMQFLAPGLIMMSVITNSYAGAVSAFFGVRFSGCVEEILVAPVSRVTIVAGFVAAGAMRGLIIGFMVTLISVFFTHFHIQSPVLLFCILILTSILFSLAGFVNALFARGFDDISIVPAFVLTPLTYFAGVFYSITMLPAFWRDLSYANPLLYIVNTFRYAALGITDINIKISYGVEVVLVGVLLYMIVHFMRKGYGGKI